MAEESGVRLRPVAVADEDAQRTEFHFALDTQAGEFLGVAGISSFDSVNRRANLGYWVRSGRTGRGVATSAVGQLAEWAFENTDVTRLEIVVAVENRASLRVAEKAGAAREGVLRKRLVLGGRTHDAVMLSLTR